jgi:hypothetical protein
MRVCKEKPMIIAIYVTGFIITYLLFKRMFSEDRSWADIIIGVIYSIIWPIGLFCAAIVYLSEIDLKPPKWL